MNRDDTEFNRQSVEYQNMGMKSQLKDAQANKTISIVTMTFLPATAVAAICSMNVFDWQQPDRVRVSPHFWIFWVVALLLTALVIGIFLIWKRRLHVKARRQKRDAEEEKAKEEEDSDDDAIPDEPKYGASKQRANSMTRNQQKRPAVEEKRPHVYQDEEREEQDRSSRRRSRHRSHSRRSRTTSRNGDARPGFSRAASGLSFRGESTIV
jgi:flagellar biosynthesis/type III secretory pathway M-ring protein FliF/YscJ